MTQKFILEFINYFGRESIQNIIGDIVEVGTGTGFSMLALLNYLKNWNKKQKKSFI